MQKERDELIHKLVEINTNAMILILFCNKFRVRGDTVEIYPAGSSGNAVRVEFFGDEIDRICEINPLTGKVEGILSSCVIYPASHYVVSHEKLKKALNEIYNEMVERVAYFEANGKLLEAQRIKERTMNDIEMLKKQAFAKVLKIIHELWATENRAKHRLHLLIIFLMIFLCL